MMVAVPTSTDFLTNNWDKACQVTDQQILASQQSAAKGLGDTWPMGFVLAPNQETRLRIGMGDITDGLIEKQIKRALQITNEMPSLYHGEDIRSGQFDLLGCMRYKDQFATHHTTRFCFVYLNDKISPAGFYPCNAIEAAD